jgi:hypothetical protein
MARRQARSFLPRCSALLFLALLAAGTAQQAVADIVIGTQTGPDNAFPFGDGYAGEYQQLYASSNFSRPVTITGVGFASDTGFTGQTRVMTVTIGLSTSAATLNTMSSNYAANEGADSTQVFNGTVTYVAAGNKSFDLNFTTTPFTYNPSNGSLLLDVVMGTNTGPTIGFLATLDAVTSRVYNNAGTGSPVVDADHGLITILRTTSPVPEPSVLALAGVGTWFGALGAFRRRSRRQES